MRAMASVAESGAMPVSNASIDQYARGARGGLPSVSGLGAPSFIYFAATRRGIQV